jgi:putative ABC transport system substrate-binding protein
MRRRKFLGLLAGVTITRPYAVRVEQPAMPLIGFLCSRSAADSSRVLDGFHRGLAEAGLTEGQNVAVIYRWANGSYDRLAPLAA